MMNQIRARNGNAVVSILILSVIAWGIYSLFKDDSDLTMIAQEHPNYSSYRDSTDCNDLEPINPYDEGSGHYAGFEWGENGNSCGGNSSSFIEGCEKYESQEESYQSCLDNN